MSYTYISTFFLSADRFNVISTINLNVFNVLQSTETCHGQNKGNVGKNVCIFELSYN